jgi:tetratricopeptide (TPR) repeat protein
MIIDQNKEKNDMKPHARALRALLAALLAALALPASADPQALERARGLIASGNAKQAYEVLAPLQDRLVGQPEFDYLLGVAALDSGRIEDAVIAFERVLALIPNHAGAQMDLARAYYAAGSFDLAEAGFLKLREANPPPAAQQAINRYLEAIQSRRHQAQAGWNAFSELGLGYDSNITGVPVDFGSAAQQSFNLVGIEPTGNAIKRSAPFVHGALGAEYSRPISRGFSAFAGGEVRGRAYRRESDFNSISAEVRGGGAFNDGPNQWRLTGSYLEFSQSGDAPGEPQPTNDRRMLGIAGDWRHALGPKSQVGLAVHLNRVRFPDNGIEDFDQLFVAASWLRSFERKGVPMLYLTVFASDDRARESFFDGTTKSKHLGGVRSYLQYSVTPRLQGFGALAVIHRRDKDAFARSTLVERGRDTYGEAAVGLHWQFRERCGLRLQYAFSTNRSNIDIYDFNRHEITSAIRCELT